MPERIQRKRSKGWRMPENTVYVGRPTKWGNPWTLQAAIDYKLFEHAFCAVIIVKELEAWLKGTWSEKSEHLGMWKKLEKQREILLSSLPELRGKNLACWCTPGQPCHADVLLRLANIACTGQLAGAGKADGESTPSANCQ